MGDVDAILRALWARAEAHHARVMYNDAPNGRGTENGYFDPREGADLGPLISICDDSDRRMVMKPCSDRNDGTTLTETERMRDLIRSRTSTAT